MPGVDLVVVSPRPDDRGIPCVDSDGHHRILITTWTRSSTRLTATSTNDQAGIHCQRDSGQLNLRSGGEAEYDGATPKMARRARPHGQHRETCRRSAGKRSDRKA